MPADILLTVIATSVIQSVFGVGVLLFGTPVLLLLGYDFINALSVLLPISIAINCLQIIKHFRFIDTDFYKKVLLYSIPLVILCLLFVSTAKNKYLNNGWIFLGFGGGKKFFPSD